MTVVAADQFGVFVERIDQDQRSGGVGRVVERLEQVRDDFARHLVRQTSQGVVGGEEGDAVGGLDGAVGSDAADGQGQEDVPGLTSVAVQPGAVEPPGVVGVEAEGEDVAGQFGYMGHPGGDFQSGVEVEGGPGGIDRRDNGVFGVEFAQGRGVSGDFDAGGEVAAAGFDGHAWAGVGEVMPEAEHFSGGLVGFFGFELVLVKEAASDAPGFHAEAHAIGEPDVVEAQVAGEGVELSTEEVSECSSFGDALGEGGVGLGVGMEDGVAGYEAVRVGGVGEGDFPMALVFERRDSEFRAIVKGLADADWLAGDAFAGFADDGGEPFQPAVGSGGDVGTVFLRVEVDVPACAMVGRQVVVAWRGVSQTDPVGPFEGLVQITGVFEDFAAVSQPEQDRHLVSGFQQGQPLPEQVLADCAHRVLGVVKEGLAAQFQGDVFQVHGQPGFGGNGAVFCRASPRLWPSPLFCCLSER